MALFTIIVRKVINNKWLETSLLIGLILSVALVGSIPMYQYAVMHRMLLKNLEQIQLERQEYPGKYWVYGNFTGEQPEHIQSMLAESDRFMESKVKPSFGIEAIESVRLRRTDNYALKSVKIGDNTGNVDRKASIGAISELKTKTRLVEGSYPSKDSANGVYEVDVTENAMSYMKVSLGDVYAVDDPSSNHVINMKIVGIVSKIDDSSLYWYDGTLFDYKNTFFIDYDLFQKDFIEQHVLPLQTAIWYFALDYSKISIGAVQKYLDTDASVNQYLKSKFKNFGTDSPAFAVLSSYFEKANTLQKMLWSLNLPVLLMLVFYLYMISNLIVERQKTEISVIRSRGANRLQIVGLFFVENTILGILALIFGPFVGKAFTTLLGASSGFLEFVQRDAIQVKLTKECYGYALLAVLFSIFVTLIPVFRATKQSVVNHKQQMARLQPKTFWHKYFIDVLLLGISLYGLHSYQSRIKSLTSLGLEPSDITIDPLLLIVPTLFIIGFGLFVLRNYPWIINITYWIGKRWWPPSLYSTLIQVGRSTAQYQFLMVFLILTVSTGLFSASAARTINQNLEDQLKYKNGADIILTPKWENVAEPDFQTFAELPGAEHMAKVFRKDGVSVTSAQGKTEAQLIGIDTYDFGHTAWFQDDLLDHQLGEYLDLIARNPDAVLISKELANRYHLKPGDSIQIGWNGVGAKSFTVYAIIAYFPATIPGVLINQNKANASSPLFVIGHLKTIQQGLALEPYQIWIKLKSEDAREELYNAILAKGLKLTGLTDTVDSLIHSRNDPIRLAVNGGLTLGFIISVLVTFIGFLIYWVLTLNGRLLQYGVMRAMGISFKSLIAMITAEQLLTSGAGIIIGALVGKMACSLFIPLLQISFSKSIPLPPFRVFFNANDSYELYSIITIMVLTGLMILGCILFRIKIHQAIKLGED